MVFEPQPQPRIIAALAEKTVTQVQLRGLPVGRRECGGVAAIEAGGPAVARHRRDVLCCP